MRVDEKQAEEASRILRANYYTAIRSMADDAADRVASGEIKTAEELREWMHETVDGSAWVIYFAAARQVICLSDNWDAIDGEGVDHPRDLRETVTVAAYYAASADLLDDLGNPYSCSAREDASACGTCGRCGARALLNGEEWTRPGTGGAPAVLEASPEWTVTLPSGAVVRVGHTGLEGEYPPEVVAEFDSVGEILLPDGVRIA